VEALLPALVACLLAEMAGRVQLTTESYAVTRPAWGLCAALLLSTTVSLAIGAAGGAWMARLVTYEARTLLLGLALLLAGATILFRPKADRITDAPKGAPLWRYLATQLGDNSQFIVFAFAARGNAPVLATLGGLAGVMLAASLPLLLDNDFRRLPLVTLRRASGMLLVLTGLWSALHALELI
jgi:putative Ca2+/H+ antiporter (TMEM165/GDT1 family)